jgi:hypothetical protein
LNRRNSCRPWIAPQIGSPNTITIVNLGRSFCIKGHPTDHAQKETGKRGRNAA